MPKISERLKPYFNPEGKAIMGILNVTPDSFYDGGNYQDPKNAIEKGLQMYNDGADIIDIGGQSTRPGAESVSSTIEWARVAPVIEGLLEVNPDIKISIDTYRAEIARKAVENSVVIVNDISAGSLDPELLPAVAEFGVPYVLMHMQGTPVDMQNSPSYDDTVEDVLVWFSNTLDQISESGIKDVIIDPGFGFGKSLSDNYKLLAQLDKFQRFEAPILVGLSRKSMISKALGCSTKNTLNGTTALHSYALDRGANILRVHDVKMASEVLTLHHHLCNA